MHIVISPAKKQDFSKVQKSAVTRPVFEEKAYDLVIKLKSYSVDELGELLKISPKLAQLNFDRFYQYVSDVDSAHTKGEAIFAYAGDTYQGLDAHSFSDIELSYAQQHMYILSGLYGILRPLDLMQPYRLEMGTKELIKGGLHQYWKETIADYLNKAEVLSIVNLASDEYGQLLVRNSRLKADIFNVQFYQDKPEGLKNIGLMSKKARGQMAAFIVKQQCKTLKDLIKFSGSGYKFKPSLSSGDKLVFVR